MKLNPFSLIRQHIEYLESHINMLKENMASTYYSESSKYETQKDLNAAIGELSDLKEEIRMLSEEFTK